MTIVVGAGADAGVEFTTDTNEVVAGQCATLRWRAVNVREVYLGTQGVRGEDAAVGVPSGGHDL